MLYIQRQFYIPVGRVELTSTKVEGRVEVQNTAKNNTVPEIVHVNRIIKFFDNIEGEVKIIKCSKS